MGTSQEDVYERIVLPGGGEVRRGWTRRKRPRAIALDMESGTIAANGYR